MSDHVMARLVIDGEPVTDWIALSPCDCDQLAGESCEICTIKDADE